MVNDLISRQAAIDAINTRRSVYSGMWGKGLSLAVDTLRDLPSAQPETGYWISARDEDGRHMWLICSECRAKETNLKAKYCPMCGRKMA